MITDVCVPLGKIRRLFHHLKSEVVELPETYPFSVIGHNSKLVNMVVLGVSLQ